MAQRATDEAVAVANDTPYGLGPFVDKDLGLCPGAGFAGDADVMGPRRTVPGVAAAVALVFIVGCQGQGGASAPTPRPSESTAAPTAMASPTGNARPIAQDLVVERSRSSASRVADTLAIGGFPESVVVDHVAGEVYVNGCGHGDEGFDAPGDIRVIDVATHEVTTTIPMGPCPRMAIDPYARVLYVRDREAGRGTISVIDTTSHQITGTINVGDRWLGSMVVDPTTGLLYVGEPGSLNGGTESGTAGTVAVVDGATGRVIDRITVGPDPSGMAVDPAAGAVYVADAWVGALTVIDSAVREVTNTIQLVQGMESMHEGQIVSFSVPVVDSTAQEVYVTDTGSGTVYVVDTGSLAVTETIPAEIASTESGDPAAGVVYMYGAASKTLPWGVIPIDTATHQLGEPVPVEGASALAVDPTTGAVWVLAIEQGTVTILESVQSAVGPGRP